jgi:predicted Rossmann fold flavoprotein
VTAPTDDFLWDLCIVGAGAAGLTAGIFAAETLREKGKIPRVLLLDGAKAVGAKILVAGGGRCNVTNERVLPSDYNGPRTIVRNVLAAFDERRCVTWFESMGVKLKREETGKLFPVTDEASTILNALLSRLNEAGAELRPGSRVVSIAKDTAETFVVRTSCDEFRASHVLLCTGGKSLPKTGSDGFGWEIAKSLGHSVTPTYPALAPLVLSPSFFHGQLSGLSHEAELVAFADGKIIDRRTGSMLWTHFGISGPVALDASRHWEIARATGAKVELKCSLLPGRSFDEADREVVALINDRPKATVANVLGQKFPQRLAAALLAFCGIDGATPAGQVSRDARRTLIHALIALPLPVERTRGWNYAEVTAGGVPMSEVNFRTMESRKTPGLYLAGEMLDVDGRIGGFNFQWAWATGYLAGRAAGSVA